VYREPDEELQAEAERKLGAEQRLDDAAARGREARESGASGVEKRLLRTGSSPLQRGTAIAIGVGTFAVGAFATVVGAPVAAAVGVGTLGAGILGSAAVRRLRLRREHAWLVRLPFPVVGYLEVLQEPRTITAFSVRVTLDTVEQDDRDRIVDLLGRLDSVDPVVTVDGTTLVVDVLCSGSPRTFLRSLIERVALVVHEARRVRVVQISASTAARSASYDIYG
jgi:hypothetical protein